MRKPFFLSPKERLRISEALGMMIADQEIGLDGHQSRNLYFDRRLLTKWDNELPRSGRVQVVRGKRK